MSNITPAMQRVAEELELTRQSTTAPADKQILFRASEDERERWKEAADRLGLSMSEFLRTVANKITSDLLDCHHTNRLVYPWSEFCKDCGIRLR